MIDVSTKRSRSEKRAAVLNALRDPEQGAWSNVLIAKQCQVSVTLVWRIRAAHQTHIRRIYFVQAICGGPVKIGITDDIASRLSTIQAHSPVEVRVLAMMPGTYDIERELHARFAADRLHGEWFAASPAVMAFIEGIPQEQWPERSPTPVIPRIGIDGKRRRLPRRAA